MVITRRSRSVGTEGSLPLHKLSRPSSCSRNMSITTSAPSEYEESWIASSSGNQTPYQTFAALHIFGNGKNISPRKISTCRTSNKQNKKMIILASVLLLAPWLRYVGLRIKYRNRSNQMKNVQSDYDVLNDRITMMAEKVKDLNERTRNLENSKKLAAAELRQSGNIVIPGDDPSYMELESVENRLFSRIDLLKEEIQKHSRREIEQEFGSSGQFNIEVSLQLYNDRGIPTGSLEKLVIETAPLSLMPLSVHHFLQMVSKKLWDGLAFVHRDIHSHVMQATPLDVKTGSRAIDRFENAGLTKLAFSEYSTDYPHLAYTVGFSGRPGGPDFYINTIDNSQAHGPFEQHGEVDDGESCFGTVVQGRDVLDRILERDSKAQSIKVVGITSMKILDSK